MKKIINKKSIIVIFLLFIVSFSIGYFTTTNNKLNEEVTTPDQDENYDKMKISYVKITERKTGLGAFDSTSDMEGNDSSDSNEYIRTNDELRYKIEVGVALNLDNPDVTESSSPIGGKIKVKVTVPTDANGNPLFDWKKDVWMSNVQYSNNRNVLYAEYRVTDQLLAGGNQQLSFTLITMKNPFVFDESNKPTFEVWMDGNKPDNEDSAADSIIIKDEEDLIITGTTKYNLYTTKGDINVSATRNGTKGQYVNFISMLELYNRNKTKGFAYPTVNSMYTKMKIEYYYRNRSNSSGEFTKLADDNSIISNINLVAYNINWDEYSVNGYPNSGDNYLAEDRIIGAISSWFSCGRSFSSGNLTATYSNGILSTTNRNFYNYIIPGCEGYGADAVVFSNAIELFVPYLNDGNSYDYRIKVSFTDFGNNSTSYYEDELLYDNYVYLEFSDYLSGHITANLRGYPNYSSYYDSTFAVDGKVTGLRSELVAADGPYYGGEKRLITFDASKLKITQNENKYYEYDENYSEVTGRGTMKYGIYKDNPSVGLDSNALVNSTLIDDFDWYNSPEEAQEYGVVTAYLWDNPSYRGNNLNTYLDVYVAPIVKEENYNKVAIARHKVWVYGNSSRTIEYPVYTNSGENYYVASTYDDVHVVLRTGGSPKEAGESVRINKGYVDLQDRYFGFDKGTYSVLDNRARLRIQTQIDEVIGIVDRETDILYVNFYYQSPYLTYIPGSCNIEPYSVSPGYNTYLKWSMEVPALGPYPDIICEFEIDPFTPNNSRVYHVRQWSYFDSHKGYGSGGGGWWSEIFITNLSGSNTRKVPSKRLIEIGEEFDVTGNIYNISEDVLYNVRTVELLPKDGDSRGSIIHGSYSIKIKSIDDGVRLYYSTGDVDSIGIDKDDSNNLVIRNVDLNNDNRWVEAFVDDVLPQNATAIVTVTNNLAVRKGKGFSYHVTPINNEYGDTYYFGQYASSDNLTNSLFSTYKDVQVVNRTISGYVFLDKDRNGYYSSYYDSVLANKQISVYKSNGEFVTTVTTDANGKFEVDHLDKDDYYITYTLDEHQMFVDRKNSEYSNVSIIDPETGKSYTIILSQNADYSIVHFSKANIGVKTEDAQVIVHHYIEGTTTKICDDQIIDSYYESDYTTSPVNSNELYEEYNNMYSYNGTSEGDSTSGIITKKQHEVIYYYAKKPAALIVQHYLKDSNQKVSKDQIFRHSYGDSYTTSSIENANYTYAGSSGDSTSGIIVKDYTTVIYYYEIKPATVTVHHYIEGTETKVHEDDTLNRNYNDVYETSYYDPESLDDDYKNIYKYNNHSIGNKIGIVSSDNYEVIYYYEKIDAELIVHHFVKDTTFKVHENEKINLKLGDTYETHYKESDELVDSDYVYDSVVGEPNVVMDATRKEVTYYYVLKTGNIIVHHITDDTNEELCPDETYNGNYKDKYNYDSCTELTNINYTFKEVNSNDTKSVIDKDKVTGRIRQDSTEITYYYTYKPGQIVVHHFLSGTRERVADDVIANGKINQEYTSSSKELEGYKLVKEPEEKTLTFMEDTQESVYEYERLKYKIEVAILEGEGSITGSEAVFYGNNAKKNIIITPAEGYEINSVVVNGEELTSLDVDGMRLPKFENVKEDILVEVIFAKKTQVVPITGKHSSLVYISSIVFIIAISSITIFELKKDKKHK